MMNKFSYEIIIIGGGPAGSSAAIYLRNMGYEVCIIEKKAFPRETLCGEFLSLEVINAIKELELFEKFIQLSPNKINSFRFCNNDGRQAEAGLNFSAYGMKRGTFDNLLLTSAKEKGADVIQPAEVKSISIRDGLYNLIVKAEDGTEKEVDAKIVIAAYGRQNTIDRNLNRHFINSKSGLNGIKFHVDYSMLKYFDKNEIHIYAADGIYCGVNAVNNNQATICFLEDRSVLQYSPVEQIKKLCEKNIFFANLFNSEFEYGFEKLPVYGTGNIYFGKREKVVNGIFMIGDAAGVIAPLAGDGIGMALESAKILTAILNDKIKGKISPLQAQVKYEAEWKRKFKRRLYTAMLIQNFLLKGYLRNPGFKTVKIFPFLLPALVKSTRS